MLVEHTFTALCKCPVNGMPDHYQVTLRLNCLVRVEDIRVTADQLCKEPKFQETLTEELAKAFDCECETVGRHGDFQTRVVCK